MPPTEHTTIPRRPGRAATPTDNHGVALTERDIIDRIRALASRQSTQYVSINNLRTSLGLSDDDERSWLKLTLMKMDVECSIALSPLEKPQDLDIVSAQWWAANASGLRCHEVAALPQAESRITDHASRAPRLNFTAACTAGLQELQSRKRAARLHLDTPTQQQQRIGDVLRAAAVDLQRMGMLGRRSA
jgi:hypothetical protein